jgi:hypothetical protein
MYSVEAIQFISFSRLNLSYDPSALIVRRTVVDWRRPPRLKPIREAHNHNLPMYREYILGRKKRVISLQHVCTDNCILNKVYKHMCTRDSDQWNLEHRYMDQFACMEITKGRGSYVHITLLNNHLPRNLQGEQSTPGKLLRTR